MEKLQAYKIRIKIKKIGESSMTEIIQTSQLLLSLSLLVTALKRDFRRATILMVLLIVALYSVK